MPCLVKCSCHCVVYCSRQIEVYLLWSRAYERVLGFVVAVFVFYPYLNRVFLRQLIICAIYSSIRLFSFMRWSEMTGKCIDSCQITHQRLIAIIVRHPIFLWCVVNPQRQILSQKSSCSTYAVNSATRKPERSSINCLVIYIAHITACFCFWN